MSDIVAEARAEMASSAAAAGRYTDGRPSGD
jgi:hypothetical protein